MTSRLARTGVLAAAAAAALGIAGTAAPVAASTGGTDVATDVSGSITVLTQRTDIVDTVFADYKKTVRGQVPGRQRQVRGDHRLRGRGPDPHEHRRLRRRAAHPQLRDRRPARRLLRAARHGRRPRARSTASSTEQAFDGQVYGIADHRQRPGLRLQQDGLGGGRHHRPCRRPPRSSSPTCRRSRTRPTPIPLYTNYKDGWPLTQWEGNRGSVSGDPDAVNDAGPRPTPRGPRARTTT